jgi:hypothetical protein
MFVVKQAGMWELQAITFVEGGHVLSDNKSRRDVTYWRRFRETGVVKLDECLDDYVISYYYDGCKANLSYRSHSK